MIFRLIAGVLATWIVGFAITWLVRPRGNKRINFWLGLPVGLVSGLGLTSIFLFLWLMARHGNGTGEPAAMAIVAIVLLAAALGVQRRKDSQAKSSAASVRGAKWLWAAFLLAVLIATISFVSLSLVSPHGRWDAWYNWNRHARFMYVGGAHWEDVFLSPESDLGATTYPMLTPGAIAQLWFFSRRESLLIPALVSFLFAASCAGLLTASLFWLRSPKQGLLAGIVLLCSQEFFRQATTQYADVPLACYMLAAVLLLCLCDKFGKQSGWLFLAGISAGLAAWTKPEGLLFVAVLVFARCVVVVMPRGIKGWIAEAVPFAAGLLPILAFVLYFKFGMIGSQSYYMFEGQTAGTMMSRIFSLHRYVTITKAFVREILKAGGWHYMLPPILLIYLLVAGVNRSQKDRLAIYTSGLTTLLMTACYFVVYVMTPLDLETHLQQSLDRLVIQLLPLGIFTFFLLARTLEETVPEYKADLSAEAPPSRVQGQIKA